MDSNNSGSKFFTIHFSLFTIHFSLFTLHSLHRVLPTATGVNACGIGELFQTGHLFGSQHNPGSLGSLKKIKKNLNTS